MDHKYKLYLKDFYKGQRKDFKFGSHNFEISQVYDTFIQKKRYPVQAFLDIYFFDSLQEFSSEKNEYERLYNKCQKFSQLSQKYLNLLEAEKAYKNSIS
mmetsp:Transcript_21289/g.23696  ORF Transcript_21289/g.23696 Transcript_21289/m.23696 type:complete len:99 (+) Transcript_21289:2-298(+)